ncbi:MAG TPA: recombination protein RecR [Gammaproteobacteria bacterium]|nr:recombination protein RecR [Gammaproteobacteria bacterium]|tara:strand:- start:816 stop:1430 length:615 start_codon:yes stop_codon:yes gene_type:complete
MALIDDLVSALQTLPGVGPKSAQRMALYLLQRDRDGGNHLGQVLQTAMAEVRQCERCRNLTETPVCRLCSDPRRETTTLCIVESPADVLALEQAGGFAGQYFVLHGHLSPIDGIGPSELGMDALRKRVSDLFLQEIILATNPTVEGEATAHYISAMFSEAVGGEQPVRISRIAHGVPLGSEIEFTDGGTLSHALQGRRVLHAVD